MKDLNCVNVVQVDGLIRTAYAVNKTFDKYAEPKDFGSVKKAEAFLDKEFKTYTPSSQYEIVVKYVWRKDKE
jgi:hypothetical protein